MLDAETRGKCRALGIPGLADALDTVCEDPLDTLPFEDRIRVAVGLAHREMVNRRADSLLRAARRRAEARMEGSNEYGGDA